VTEARPYGLSTMVSKPVGSGQHAPAGFESWMVSNLGLPHSRGRSPGAQPPTGFPQFPQNFAPGPRSEPHSVHFLATGARGCPQLPQNFPVPGVPQFGQAVPPAATGAGAAGGRCC
jgi:hypothetical protein